MGYRLLPRHAQPPNHGRPAVPRARPPTRQLRTTPQETANPLAGDKASTRRLDRCAPKAAGVQRVYRFIHHIGSAERGRGPWASSCSRCCRSAGLVDRHLQVGAGRVAEVVERVDLLDDHAGLGGTVVADHQVHIGGGRIKQP
jgi:hypothetical protein